MEESVTLQIREILFDSSIISQLPGKTGGIQIFKMIHIANFAKTFEKHMQNKDEKKLLTAVLPKEYNSDTLYIR